MQRANISLIRPCCLLDHPPQMAYNGFLNEQISYVTDTHILERQCMGR